MTGTASRSKGVRREAESEGSVKQNSDPTNRNRIEGQRSGVTRQWTRRPDSHPGTAGVNPAGAEGKRHDLPWEVSVSVWASQTTVLATGWEGHREVSRGHSRQRRADEGPNPLRQGADEDTHCLASLRPIGRQAPAAGAFSPAAGLSCLSPRHTAASYTVRVNSPWSASQMLDASLAVSSVVVSVWSFLVASAVVVTMSLPCKIAAYRVQYGQ
jgi:hypothetical protein